MLQPSHPYITTRKTIALTIWNVPTKWCLCFLIHCQVYQSFPSKEQASFNYMAAVIPCTVILEPSSFLYCLQFKFEFCKKELMLWVTVLSQSSFHWLYRACPFWAEENIIYLISVLTIVWCPCVAFSWTVGKGSLLWPEYSLDKTLLAFALLHFVHRGQSFIQLSFDFLLLHFNPLWWKGHLFFGVSPRKSCRSS